MDDNSLAPYQQSDSSHESTNEMQSTLLKRPALLASPGSDEGRDYMGRLPTELLLKIFTFALVEDAPVYATRLRLTHVCRLWRNSIIPYAPFWGQIALRPSGSVPNRRMMTELDFERAKICPDLDVTISMEWKQFHYWMDVGETQADVIAWRIEAEHHRDYMTRALDLDVRARIRILRFGHRPFDLIHVGATQYDYFIPLERLQELYMDSDWSYSISSQTNTNQLMRKILLAGNSMQVLRLFSLLLPDAAFPTTLRKLHLTMVTIESDVYFPSVLVRLTNLEELVLSGRSHENGLVWPVSAVLRITLPRLRLLSLQPLHEIEDAHLIRQLECPDLKALHLRYDANGVVLPLLGTDRDPMPNIMRAVASQAWKLEELLVDGFPRSENLMAPFLLHQASSLRRLAIGEDLYATVRHVHGAMMLSDIEEVALRISLELMYFAIGPRALKPGETDYLYYLYCAWRPQIPSPEDLNNGQRLEIELQELLCADAMQDRDKIGPMMVQDTAMRLPCGRRVYLYTNVEDKSVTGFNRLRNERTRLAIPSALCRELYVGPPMWMK
ncbi:hypothetical protein CALVIDRAFT_543434 [Calocera viscosa TUFC12733]|uniref:F-box domain-containing protein n=1 Tax=Calocera viscosa (strain TUFC12733) TaxID=1330018 RepID=A0A167FKW7_CALVF|nr:hypothetical protein CALVIDRAFT_543434 [Calocera viscosa TUFC12733]